MEIRKALIPDEVPVLRELFEEYAGSLGIPLDFQGFEGEVADLPGEGEDREILVPLPEEVGEAPVLMLHGVLGTDEHEHAARRQPGGNVLQELRLDAGVRHEKVNYKSTVENIVANAPLTGKPLGTRTYELAKGAKVLIDDGSGRKTGFRDGTLADVPVGTTVSLRLSGQKADLVYAEGALFQGELKQVDVKGRKVTALVPEPSKKTLTEKTFTVPDEAKSKMST